MSLAEKVAKSAIQGQPFYEKVGDTGLLAAHQGTVSDQLSKDYLDLPQPIHVFSMARASFTQLKHFGNSHSILLTGDPGSGKSSSQRMLVRHWCDLSKNSSKKTRLQSTLLKMETVLNAFLSAKLNVSSCMAIRHTEYHFDATARMVGAKYSVFGLEDSPFIDKNAFLICHHLMNGLSLEEKKALSLNGTFKYLPRLDKFESDLDAIREGLKAISIGKRQQNYLFRLLAAILNLGNVTFEDLSDKDQKCKVKNERQLITVSELMEIQPQLLHDLLTCEKEKSVSIPLDSLQAAKKRDHLAFMLYASIVHSIVDAANGNLCKEKLLWKNYISIINAPGIRETASSLTTFNRNYANDKIIHSFLNRDTGMLDALYDRVYEENLQQLPKSDLFKYSHGKLTVRHGQETVQYDQLQPISSNLMHLLCQNLSEGHLLTNFLSLSNPLGPNNVKAGVSQIIQEFQENQTWFIFHVKIKEYDQSDRKIQPLGLFPSRKYSLILNKSQFISKFKSLSSPNFGTVEDLIIRHILQVYLRNDIELASFDGNMVSLTQEGINQLLSSMDSLVPMFDKVRPLSENWETSTASGSEASEAESIFWETEKEQPMLLEKKWMEKDENPKLSKERNRWLTCVWIMTWWVPSFALKWAGIKRSDQQIAWREKFALFLLIILLCLIILFSIAGAGLVICPKQNVLSRGEVSNSRRLNTDDNPTVYMYGSYYEISKIVKKHISARPQDGREYWRSNVLGQDVSQMFSKEFVWEKYCPYFPKPDPSFRYYREQSYYLLKGGWIDHNSVYQTDYIEKLKDYRKGDIVWTQKEKEDYINQEGTSNRIITAYDKVYDVSSFYFATYSSNFLGTGVIKNMTKALFDADSQNSMSDSTILFEDIRAADSEQWNQIMSCMDGLFLVGRVDHRNDLKCVIPNYILLASSILLCLIIGFKFVAALQFTRKEFPEPHEKFVILQVPCYTESEESLVRTLESLAMSTYSNQHKLLFIVADGMIIGSGNDRPTPRIVLDILGVDPSINPPALPFKSLGEGNKQLNYGKIYSGLYDVQGNSVPFIVLVKVGKPEEIHRPGNRGKRDSQLILMNFLSKVHYNLPMSPLELELYRQMRHIIGVEPSLYEYVMMIDADTVVMKDALNRMVAKMAKDARIIGLCGETKLANAKESLITWIQVYEYFISHHLSKAFESLFGTVTCLPGCFCMYRIRSNGRGQPYLISQAVLNDYAENNVNTLHLKNLLHLGEDRYLTTLMMKHFPSMKLIFTSDAKCITYCPDSWSVILSQRRRWINSTVHNLFELVNLPGMCGFCCFSMRFVVFIDLFATIVQPAGFLYLLVLFYMIYTGQYGQENFPLISIILVGAIYGVQVILFLLKREWDHIGWMVIYILATPVFSFILPLYSFWHFDDFSWGSTRLVIGDGKKVKYVADSEPFDPSSIPLKKWSEVDSKDGMRPQSFATQERMSFYELPKSGFPSDAQIKSAVFLILKEADLSIMTRKQVREQLADDFKVDLSEKHTFIHKCIDEYLSSI